MIRSSDRDHSKEDLRVRIPKTFPERFSLPTCEDGNFMESSTSLSGFLKCRLAFIIRTNFRAKYFLSEILARHSCHSDLGNRGNFLAPLWESMSFVKLVLEALDVFRENATVSKVDCLKTSQERAECVHPQTIFAAGSESHIEHLFR